MYRPDVNVSDDEIVAIADGELMDAATVSDETFSQKMPGESVAFRYQGNKVILCAPVNGTLNAVFPTGHAYGITTKNGVELRVIVAHLRKKGWEIEDVGAMSPEENNPDNMFLCRWALKSPRHIFLMTLEAGMSGGTISLNSTSWQ